MMKTPLHFFISSFFALLVFGSPVWALGPWTGEQLNRVAFPIGGLGAGMYCLEGTGAISHMSVRNQMEFFHEPCSFAALCLQGETEAENVARLLEGPLPDWKYFGKPGAGVGSGGTTYGLPRFRECRFSSRFPFAEISLRDADIPCEVEIVGWSPFTPPDADSSSLPLGALEYRFTSTHAKPQSLVFSFNSRNFLNHGGSIGPTDGGFVLYDRKGKDREKHGAFAFFACGDGIGKDDVKVDHCWFRGGWFDSMTVAWDNVVRARMLDNPPLSEDDSRDAPGATLCVPFTLEPGETKTIRLMTCWYWPDSQLAAGHRRTPTSGSAFQDRPAPGAAEGQQPVSGFLGRGLVNTYYPAGDAPQGTLVSPEFTIERKAVHLLVGGGRNCSVQLWVDGKPLYRASGEDSERLRWTTWNVTDQAGKRAAIKIVDDRSDAWGHTLCDHIVFSDEAINDLKIGIGNEITNDPKRAQVFADFEGERYGDWKPEKREEPKPAGESGCLHGDACDPALVVCSDAPVPDSYKPWYSTRFGGVLEVADHWRKEYAELRARSELFAETFFDSTLPREVVDSIACNLSILKSPTVLRQHDGRLWCWEGCNDHGGSCHGSCTHVWNYTQALCHLFPDMERSLRQTEYFESSSEGTGRQAFRANLPITPGGNAFDASDGQLGGIMKAYREWRIFGSDAWLRLYWPRIRQSLDYAIKTWDPRQSGLLEERHHNTYDIDYFGPDGHCGSFYLGALAAAVEMGEYLGDDVTLYRELLGKGSRRMADELFNGEYFVQKIRKDGLDRNFGPIDPKDQSEAYRPVAELVNRQGPKYQYGDACLSDGILGLWIARCCGLDADLVPRELVEKHLLSVYEYNLRRDLSGHANPQRPSFAMGDDGGLLLGSWPHGGKLMLPFVYSDEVWTGIEYQVAAHLMMLGHTDKGLDIVRLIRKRHDGVRRNPFNEYECGHWYARALSSYGMLQALTGVRYDAVTKTLHVDSKVGDFRSFLSTATGYGTVEYKNGDARLTVVSGEIPVEKIAVKE